MTSRLTSTSTIVSVDKTLDRRPKTDRFPGISVTIEKLHVIPVTVFGTPMEISHRTAMDSTWTERDLNK